MSVAALREVRLYGRLGAEFGRVFNLAVATPGEAVRALIAVLPGFERAFLGADGRQAYHVFVGRKQLRRNLSKEELLEPLGANDPIRLVPAISGAKRGGTLQLVLGVVIAIVGIFTSYYDGGATMRIGLGLALSGFVQMLVPQRTQKTSSASNTPSYAFDGALNNVEQGGPVPVVYGRVITGSTVVSQGIRTDELVGGVSVAPPLQDLPPYEPPDPNVNSS